MPVQQTAKVPFVEHDDVVEALAANGPNDPLHEWVLPKENAARFAIPWRYYWREKSASKPGRPRIARELRYLIRKMSMANPLWGAPKIHG